MKNTTNKARIIYKTGTSIVTLVPALFLLLAVIFLSIKQKFDFDYLVYWGLFISSIVYWFIFYKNRNLVLTEHKVYLLKNNVKKMSLSLTKDLSLISFSQSKMGKILGYGTLNFTSKDGSLFSFSFISSPIVTYEKIVFELESRMIKLDPNFQRTVTASNRTDSISSEEGEEDWEIPYSNNDKENK